jgi:hypothetical protein
MTPTHSPRAGKVSGLHIRVKSRLALLTIAVGLLIPSTSTRAQSSTDEYRVKAAFIFHFAQLVDWPDNIAKTGSDQFEVCVLGEDPFRGALEESMSGKSIAELPVRINHAKAPAEIQGCRVLFIGDVEMKRSPSVLAGLKDAAVLTIGDTEDFVLQRGGIIGFCLEDSKIRFDVNLDVANRAKLKISSRILLLAKVVIGARR